MKNRVIRNRYSAILTLSRRSLPSATAVNKVHFLLDRFAKPFESTTKAVEAIFVQFPAPPGADTELPQLIAEQRKAFAEEVLDCETPVKKIPDHMRLTSADMPKALAGEEGAKNADGLAEIRHNLGSLYLRTGDEIVGDDNSSEQEPD